MVQMLAMSLGVAAAGAVLAGFTSTFGKRRHGRHGAGIPGHFRHHGTHHTSFGCDLLATSARGAGAAAGAAGGIGAGMSGRLADKPQAG